MRVARFQRGDTQSWGFIDGESVLDAAGTGVATVEEALSDGVEGLRRLRDRINSPLPLAEVRLRQPLGRPQKVVGVARNYRSHGPRDADTPDEPLLFGIMPSALIGPGDAIVLPKQAPSKVDWEVELGIVIGRRAKDVSAESALEYVAGYTVVNDVSSRAPSTPADKLFRGKSYDTFKPTGPWIATTDELGTADDLRLTLSVNGNLKQDASTADMLAGVCRLVEFCSSVFTLEPGDLIASGTPAGVGASMTPPEFLRAGDRVRCEIAGIGSFENRVADAGISLG